MRFVCSPDRLQVVAARRLRNSDHLARGGTRPCSISSVLLSANGHFPNWSLQDLLLREFRLLPFNSGTSGARQSIVEKVVLAFGFDARWQPWVFLSPFILSFVSRLIIRLNVVGWKGIKRKWVLLIDRGNVFSNLYNEKRGKEREIH